MNITVTKNQVSINTDYILNDKEYNVNKCYFTFSDEYTDDLVKKAIFVQGTSTIEMSIINNQCQIPAEVLNNGQFELRVYAYEVDGEELLLRYSPSYTTAYVRTGSYIENAESPEVITPTQFEQYMQSMNDGLNEVANVDIDAEQLDNGMSVTITNRYGENKTVYAYDGEKGETGATGATGNGIASITKTSTSGLTDTYTITFTNGNTTIFTVSNGKGIVSVEKTGTNLLADTYTITYNDNTTSSFVIMNGKGIASIELTSTSDLVDTYTITYNDNTTTTYNVTNGNGILSIEKTGTVDNVDTYTIYYTNGTTSTFTVTNSTVTDQEFETLETEVNKYKTLSLLLPKVTGEGSSIELNDTVEGVTIDITPEGNTSQITYSGKNLVNVLDGTYINGNEITAVVESGKITLNGTSTANRFTQNFTGTLYLKTGTYTLSINNITTISGGNNNCIRVSDLDGTTISGSTCGFGTINNSTTFDIESDGYYKIQIRTNNGTTYRDFIIKPQLEKGSTATDYEPYVGGVPSPNPEYPQDIRVVTGDNTIEIIGKNLFDGEIETGGWSFTYGQSLSKAPNNNQLRCSNKILVEPNKEYIFSLNGNAVTQTVRYIFADKDNIVISSLVNNTGKITIPNNCKYLVFHSTELKTVYGLELTNPMIEQNNMATTYEPYQQQSYVFYLEDLVLCKIGNYQDYIYKSNNKWYIHKDIGKVVLDGSENWAKSGSYSNAFFTNISGAKDIPVSGDNNIYVCCDYYDRTYKTNLNNLSYCCALSNSSNLLIRNVDFTTNNNFKNWLSTHNTTVYYVLDTPTTTEITDTTLINQLNNLYSAVANQDKTFIECTSTELNNVPLIVKVSTYKDISSILNPVMEREE